MMNKRQTGHINNTESRCLNFYRLKNEFFDALLEQLTANLFDIYPQLIAGFAHKYGLKSLDKFCNNPKINANYKKNHDFYKLYKMLSKLKQRELMDIYKKIKLEMKDYSPFAEFLDTSLDLMLYDPEDIIYD